MDVEAAKVVVMQLHMLSFGVTTLVRQVYSWFAPKPEWGESVAAWIIFEVILIPLLLVVAYIYGASPDLIVLIAAHFTCLRYLIREQWPLLYH